MQRGRTGGGWGRIGDAAPVRGGGFTLIEILVSVLVISLAILGLVGLESFSLQNNQNAYFRSQATLLAYDLADKMRANPEAVSSGSYKTAVSDASDSSYTPSATCFSYTASVSSCSASQLAEQDAATWQESVRAKLPAGVGSLDEVSGLQQIKVFWDENRDGVAEQFFTVDVQL